MVVDTLTVSSKGQIVLPANIRKKLSINAGSKLAAYTSGNIIMLKVINLPSEDDFRSKLDEAQEWAKEVGYTEDEVNDIIKSVRRRKRA